MKKPNLFIPGAPKCGTTSMAFYLGRHPEIFVSPYKEPHYFNIDSKHRFTFSEEQYLRNFINASNSHKYLVDASVWYLYSKVAVDEVLKYNPGSKFIVMLRNPADMFYSLHQQLLFNGTENIDSPLQAWNIQNERKKGLYIPYACRDKTLLQYRDICLLGEQVNRLLQKVDKENVHFVLLDDLKNDPEASYQQVLNFLKIDSILLPDYEIKNEKKEKRFAFVSGVFSFVNRTKRSLGITNGIGIANYIVKKNQKKPSEKFKEEFLAMRPMLSKTFEDDVELLEKCISMDLENWRSK